MKMPIFVINTDEGLLPRYYIYLLFYSMTNEGSGVYCALTICLDSLNNEGYVDVFQTVRSLREQRPYILYSKV